MTKMIGVALVCLCLFGAGGVWIASTPPTRSTEVEGRGDEYYIALLDQMPECFELNKPERITRAEMIAKEFRALQFGEIDRLFQLDVSRHKTAAVSNPTARNPLISAHERLGTLNLFLFNVPPNVAHQLVFRGDRIVGSSVDPMFEAFGEDAVVIARRYYIKYGFRKAP